MVNIAKINEKRTEILKTRHCEVRSNLCAISRRWALLMLGL